MATASRAREGRDQARLEVNSADAVPGNISDEEPASASGSSATPLGSTRPARSAGPSSPESSCWPVPATVDDDSGLAVNLPDPAIEAIDEIEVAACVDARRHTVH